MKRNLLVLTFGISFLVIMTWLATTLTEIIPHRPTLQIQTAQAGPYQITLQVIPNPPSITQPATLSLQIVRQSTQQGLANAHVTLDSGMESMNMETFHTEARMLTVGTYQAQLQLNMSGPWQVRVQIAIAGAKTESATFEVISQ